MEGSVVLEHLPPPAGLSPLQCTGQGGKSVGRGVLRPRGLLGEEGWREKRREGNGGVCCSCKQRVETGVARCHFCEKLLCGSCCKECCSCHDTFCPHCSVLK